ncbi:hypothetical protein, partial [Nocardioides antri]|uniref:hypothetical protein n=1 Tax=Nocardioides antri TaxID=2607659 RepID=UPI001CB6D987
AALRARGCCTLLPHGVRGAARYCRPACSRLVHEVEFLRTQLGSDHQPMLDEMERLMSVAAERVHRYLWFVGD